GNTGRGGVPPGPAGSGRPRPTLARPPVAAADPRRSPPLRDWFPSPAPGRPRARVDLRRPRRRRPGPTPGATPALRFGRAGPRREPGGARGCLRLACEDSEIHLRAIAQSRSGLRVPEQGLAFTG